tara:strand:- start:429 stop:692 length:264 start_codon:yes stop_codon:yes gene_type:complete
MDFIDIKIKETQDWLDANEKQSCLHSMTMEDELLKQEIRHKKEILDLCNQFRHHPLRKSFENQESFGDDPYKEILLKIVENGGLNKK